MTNILIGLRFRHTQNLTTFSKFAIFIWKRFQFSNKMRTTIKDVAKKAGVGVGTVSRVFNRSPFVSPETQQKVLLAASELGYYPDSSARRLVQRKTHIIAFVERHSTQQPFVDDFTAEVLRGLHITAGEAGYHILFEPSHTEKINNQHILNLIREKHADGFIISGPRFDDELLTELNHEHIPIVLQGYLPDTHIASVDVDNYGGAKSAVNHLINLGHRKIGLITNGPLVYAAAASRKNGYLDAMREAGLEIEMTHIKCGEFSPASGYTAMQAILNTPNPPTAVFIASDTVAVGGLEAAHQQQLRVPEDLAIIGFDDIPWAPYITPAISTIRLPAQQIGRQAAFMLIKIINGEKIENEHIFLPTQLVIRDSCGARKNPKQARE
jgi:LacI family transcriptional regulator